jgi:hypothetical protein
VNTVLQLIVAAFGLGFFIAFAALPWLSSLFPIGADKKSLEIVLGLFFTVLIAIGLSLFSWDRINSTIGSAINAGVIEKLEIEKNKYNLDKAVNRQRNEFYATVNSLSLVFSNDEGFVFPINLGDDYIRRRNARDAVSRGFAYNDKLLKKIALAATLKAFQKIELNQTEIDEDTDLQLFFSDIYIYLKAWLMFSIANEREMEVSVIKQRCPNKEDTYIKALLDIKNRLIRDKKVTKYLDIRYREDSIELMDEYLDKLVTILSGKSIDGSLAR